MMDATAIFKRSLFGMTGSTPLAGDKVRLAIHAEATTDSSDDYEPAHGHTAEFRKWETLSAPLRSCYPRLARLQHVESR
jgi:hypothetical protein